MSENIATKQELRKQYLALRKTLTEEERVQRSKAIIERLIGADLLDGNIVALYQPIQGEVEIAALASFLWSRKIEVALPKMAKDGETMSFRRWCEADPLFRHPRWSMLEPFNDAPVVEPDRVIVPSVAVDRNGTRLGYGKGVYDRALAQLPAVKTIACVYDLQVADTLPCESHDWRLEVVVSELELIFTDKD